MHATHVIFPPNRGGETTQFQMYLKNFGEEIVHLKNYGEEIVTAFGLALEGCNENGV